ncbi:hypothetical protein MRB53_016312 [Persea americana]|uniref:Uncharacterized protein n=1 Tax=Persea americana TaxID=3435 RepID=A0ACC2M2G0_PERAE|nr:hypothetical protein MRB53_016312 [Persea americana]
MIQEREGGKARWGNQPLAYFQLFVAGHWACDGIMAAGSVEFLAAGPVVQIWVGILVAEQGELHHRCPEATLVHAQTRPFFPPRQTAPLPSIDVPYLVSFLNDWVDILGGGSLLREFLDWFGFLHQRTRCRDETLRALRFGQRAKLILNKAVINEIAEDDVDDLSDQIR